MALTDEDVREILRIIDESSLDELSIETAGFSLHVSKRPSPGEDARPGTDRGRWPGPDRAPAPAEVPAPAAQSEPAADGLQTIESPMLGTFYRAESPSAAAFVEVGARVQPDTTVCIIEVMKMMNSVPAGVSGVVAEVCPENGQLVEYGAPLFRVRMGETD
jgi:acetyl-CoA carboxylase biotin carboxyl carrier protein